MPSHPITRRAAFAAAGGAAAMFAATPSASAATQRQGPMRGGVRRFTLGAFEVTTLHDGYVTAGAPNEIFGENQPQEVVAALAQENFLPADRLVNNFTPTLVNTGAELILFDTGNGPGRRPTAANTLARLTEAGVAPAQIDVVVITHMHGDHIGGMVDEAGAPTYPNARYVTGAAENNFWTGGSAPEGGATLVASNVAPFAERTTFINPGDAVASGVEAVDAAGHTPGMLVYHVESEGQRVMLIADLCNHFVLSMQRPDWHVRFDMDKEGAAAARKRILGMIAADRIPFIGYHMPPPAIGYAEALGEGFRFVPESYQLAL